MGRGLGAAHGEAVALALAMPARALRVGLRPLGRLVAAISGGQARFTLPRPPLAEMERALAEYARAHGQGASTSELIHAVFEFREKVARDVMVPRAAVEAVELDTPVPRSSGGWPRRATRACPSSRITSTRSSACSTPATWCRCWPTPT